MKIGIIGCGNLGLSLVKGIVLNNPDQVVFASKRNIDELTKLNLPNVHFTTSNAEVIQQSDIILIALKPYNILPFLSEFAPLLNPEKHTLISVATGISTEEMRATLGKNIDLFRAMPNTAAAVNESITAISFSSDELQRKNDVIELFGNLGETVLIDESLMESATILGACGVAFVFGLKRAIVKGGVEVGFFSATANKNFIKKIQRH